MTRARWMVALALVGAACGGGGNSFDGVFRADTHTEDKMGCGAGVELGDHLLFKLERVEVLGTRGYKYELCTSKDACLDLGILSLRFTEETSDGWSDDTHNASTSSGSCVLTHSTGQLTSAANGGVRVEFYRFEATLTAAPAGGCTRDAASAQSASLPCVDHEILIGTRVQ